MDKIDILRKYPFCLVVTEGEDGRPVKCQRGHEGRQARSVDLHHGIIGKDKRFRKWLNVEINYQPACAYCNRERVADTYFNRMYWLEFQCRAKGRRLVRAWLDSVPKKKQLGVDWKDADTRLRR